MARILKDTVYNFLTISCCTSRCFRVCSLRYVKVRRNLQPVSLANRQIFGNVHDWTRAARVENSHVLAACIFDSTSCTGCPKRMVEFQWQMYGNLEDWKLWSREKSPAFVRKRNMLQVYGLKIPS